MPLDVGSYSCGWGTVREPECRVAASLTRSWLARARPTLRHLAEDGSGAGDGRGGVWDSSVPSEA
jgi:hypothetical protein